MLGALTTVSIGEYFTGEFRYFRMTVFPIFLFLPLFLHSIFPFSFPFSFSLSIFLPFPITPVCLAQCSRIQYCRKPIHNGNHKTNTSKQTKIPKKPFGTPTTHHPNKILSKALPICLPSTRHCPRMYGFTRPPTVTTK